MEIEVDGKTYEPVIDSSHCSNICAVCDMEIDPTGCLLPDNFGCEGIHYVLKKPKEGNMKVTAVEIFHGDGEYPKVMKHDIGCYVLFQRTGEGTVIKADNFHFLGEYSESWDMSLFHPFHGTITIEVE